MHYASSRNSYYIGNNRCPSWVLTRLCSHISQSWFQIGTSPHTHVHRTSRFISLCIFKNIKYIPYEYIFLFYLINDVLFCKMHIRNFLLRILYLYMLEVAGHVKKWRQHRSVIIIIKKKIGNARPGEGDCHPISPKTPAPHYQPIEEKKRKGK